MKICLKKTNNISSCKEYDLIICADSGIGRQLRRNLPKCICGDGIKINIIVIQIFTQEEQLCSYKN